MNKEDAGTIEKEVQALFRYLGVAEDIEVRETEDKTVTVSVHMAEPKLFIGEKGQTLFEIQHLLKLMVRKKLPSLADYYISLDINEYKKNKEEYLRDLAQTAADEVSLLKKPRELPAMAAAERRIVHASLSDRADVISESVGQDPDRRIVIRLKTE